MIAKRRIAYITGTRADFGLMRSTLLQIQANEALELAIIVTGMHLSRAHGMTVDEIEAAGLPISLRIAVEEGVASGALMARNLGHMLSQLVGAFEQLKPDLVLILGDRGEMLAAALAAIHLRIPVAHIHGGERSGTVDEPVRHAISKLSHLHLVATDESRQRLIRMGEDEAKINVVGAPGLDGITEAASLLRAELLDKYGLVTQQKLALLLFHPVMEEAVAAEAAVRAIIDTLRSRDVQVLALMPNSDAGSHAIRAELERQAALGSITLVTHLPRPEYLSFLRHADLLIGNSSSGIIEAATFGTPVVNLGQRQNLRQRNANVLDTEISAAAIGHAVDDALGVSRGTGQNVYGDGGAGARIVSLLAEIPLGETLLVKINAY